MKYFSLQRIIRIEERMNVTAANPEQLEKEIGEISHSKPFRLLL